MTQARDFDVVVAGRGDPRLGGAAIPFAYELARRLPGKLTINAAFHTATLVTDDPVRIDLTTARTETYPRPGQLPEVDVSGVDIATDLLRRDFAANAIALDIADDYGQLIDPAGGLGDIAARQIRVLHGASFSDDPTRLLRAVRYSVRLGYDLEPVTRAQFSQAVDDGVLDHVSPERIRNELEWIGGEERWAQMWAVLDIAGVLGSCTRRSLASAPAGTRPTTRRSISRSATSMSCSGARESSPGCCAPLGRCRTHRWRCCPRRRTGWACSPGKWTG